MNTTPPEIDESTFDEETEKNATLQVPIGARTIYWLHPYWEHFFNMQEVDFTDGIEDIPYENVPINEDIIYTLDGKQIKDKNSLSKGIYIINGKKYLIK